jgi:mono/diheme cytochrome c family protein
MTQKVVSMRRPTWKNLGWLLIVALASLPLIVCSGNKPSEQPAQPQPAGNVTADIQPDAVNLSNVPSASGASAGATGEAAAGKALFVKNCALCHNADSAVKKIGPGLKGLLKNKELPASHKPATEANVRAQIENGNAAKGMPAFGAKLPKAEIDSLIAYLKTL